MRMKTVFIGLFLLAPGFAFSALRSLFEIGLQEALSEAYYFVEAELQTWFESQLRSLPRFASGMTRDMFAQAAQDYINNLDDQKKRAEYQQEFNSWLATYQRPQSSGSALTKSIHQ